MPNNEIEDILKEKLSGFEADYNPADWRKMEAMLPKDSRKFFWMIAFLFSFLLIGTAGLMFNTIFNSNQAQIDHAGEKSDITTNQKYDSAKIRVNTHNELEPGYGGEIINAEKLRDEKSQFLISEQGNLTENSGLENAQINFNDGSKKDENLKQSKSTNTEASHPSPAHKKIQDSRKKERSTSILPNGGLTPSSHPMHVNDSHPITGSNRMAMHEDESAELLARLNAAMIDNGLSDEPLFPTLEATPLSKKKSRQIFEFALGAGAGPGFSWIEANRLAKPGYAVGIIQEFMFINRIGLALSQSYVHRRYDGGQYPCTDLSGFNCPISYSSEVKSIDFGIDVKANLIHKARWDWFVKAGVINTVKLRETFEFQFPQIDTIPNPPQPTLVTNNNFSSVVANESFDGQSGGFSPARGGGQPDLTISGAKRFHLAWHFATGVDVRLNSKMKLQFETGYSFTKPTVGENESRLQSIGINGRMFFLFGK